MPDSGGRMEEGLGAEADAEGTGNELRPQFHRPRVGKITTTDSARL